MQFPNRIYTEEEVQLARTLIEKGHRHHIIVEGSADFKQKAKQALALIDVAGYNDFFSAYIRKIEEVDGLSQLRQASATIWASKYAVKNTVDAASLFIQKASQVKEYLEKKLYYGAEAEKRAVKTRIEFLETLKRKSQEKETVEESERLLNMWKESSLIY